MRSNGGLLLWLMVIINTCMYTGLHTGGGSASSVAQPMINCGWYASSNAVDVSCDDETFGPGRTFVALYSGHGQRRNDIVSLMQRNIPASLQYYLGEQVEPWQGLQKSLEDVHNYVCDETGSLKWLLNNTGGGALTVLIENSKFYISNIGDNTLVMGAIDAERLNATLEVGEDSLTNTVEAARVKEAGGLVVPYQCWLHREANRDFQPWWRCPKNSADCSIQSGLVVTKRACNGELVKDVIGHTGSIGDKNIKRHQEAKGIILSEPLSLEGDLRPADQFFIMGTSLLWQVLSMQEATAIMQEALADGESLETIAQMISETGLQRWSEYGFRTVDLAVTVVTCTYPEE